MPPEAITRTIREDPSRKGLLYCGTETGLYVSLDDGANWSAWQLNLPVVPLYDLAIKGSDLIAATHGRSFWILDDLTPLHQLSDDARNANAYLFKPRDTTRMKVYEGYGSDMDNGTCYINAGPLTVAYRRIDLPYGLKGRKFLDAGQNPPDGVIVSYCLKDEPKDDITLTFLNDDGSEIRTFSSAEPPKVEDEDGPSEPRLVKTPGWHRFTWDMRLPDAEKIPGDKSAQSYLHGPVVVPGNYRVRLNVGDLTKEQSFTIAPDSRVSASASDLQAQFDLLVKIRDRVSDAHRAVNKVRTLRTQLDGWEKRLDAQQETIATADTLLESVKSLKEKLNAVEDALVQVKSESPLQYPSRLNSKMATLSAFVDNADFAPTAQTQEAFEYLSEQIGNEVKQLDDIEANDLARFNEALRNANVAPVGTAM